MNSTACSSKWPPERHALEEERKKLRTEWVERQQKRIKELEAQFAEMQKRFDENVARVIEAVKERELRASLEKTARRKGPGHSQRSTRRTERRRRANDFGIASRPRCARRWQQNL